MRITYPDGTTEICSGGKPRRSAEFPRRHATIFTMNVGTSLRQIDMHAGIKWEIADDSEMNKDVANQVSGSQRQPMALLPMMHRNNTRPNQRYALPPCFCSSALCRYFAPEECSTNPVRTANRRQSPSSSHPESSTSRSLAVTNRTRKQPGHGSSTCCALT